MKRRFRTERVDFYFWLLEGKPINKWHTFSLGGLTGPQGGMVITQPTGGVTTTTPAYLAVAQPQVYAQQQVHVSYILKKGCGLK